MLLTEDLAAIVHLLLKQHAAYVVMMHGNECFWFLGEALVFEYSCDSFYRSVRF